MEKKFFLRLYAEIGQLILEILGSKFEDDFNVNVVEGNINKKKPQISVKFLGLECEKDVQESFIFLLRGILERIFPGVNIKMSDMK